MSEMDNNANNGQAEAEASVAAELSAAAVETAEPVVDLEWVSKAELEAAQKEVASVKDRLIRLQADFDNFRRRTTKERDEIFLRANESLMTDLLPVLDHVELALGNVKPAAGGAQDVVVKGFQMVADQLQSTLVKFGLTPMDAAGKVFDANVHESLSQVPSEDVAEGSVVTQVRRGYKLGEKLLRPARVVVSSGSAKKVEGAA